MRSTSSSIGTLVTSTVCVCGHYLSSHALQGSVVLGALRWRIIINRKKPRLFRISPPLPLRNIVYIPTLNHSIAEQNMDDTYEAVFANVLTKVAQLHNIEHIKPLQHIC